LQEFATAHSAIKRKPRANLSSSAVKAKKGAASTTKKKEAGNIEKPKTMECKPNEAHPPPPSVPRFLPEQPVVLADKSIRLTTPPTRSNDAAQLNDGAVVTANSVDEAKEEDIPPPPPPSQPYGEDPLDFG